MWMNSQELAKYIGIRETALNRLIRNPKIGFPKASFSLGPKSPKWNTNDIDNFMKKSETLLAEIPPQEKPNGSRKPRTAAEYDALYK